MSKKKLSTHEIARKIVGKAPGAGGGRGRKITAKELDKVERTHKRKNK